ncbi:hypothetical protein CA236_00100 [Sphingomonas sp. ABOLG]|uniref:hypothetical protein n=1 Tax=Sphingomonas sp. ABOLG TaxID=1985880 RepID=UPI000F7F5E4D|nr:hypothetical protein [Sphingomonas sp. ABOLG]RSV20355.1 hypothetical protein CA236_00100 [Sphingomonas sp. ABOLG]
MGLFSDLAPGAFSNLAASFAAERQAQRAAQADESTVCAFAKAVAYRSDIPFRDALFAVANVAINGGPDLRTPKGWACTSALLGVPGLPITPTIH